MSTFEEVRRILAEALQLGERAAGWPTSTRLLGSLPELDSMAVVTVITALEEHYGFTVDDDEISADTFETLGTLAEFVDKKLKP
jgi:acyl carrier protein